MVEDERKLVGRWVHVHEEDDGAHRVFRRAGTSLPPSRGRAELEISSDMTVRQSRPGPDDRQARTTATRVVLGSHAPAEGRYLRVTAASADRIVVAKD